jgi:hypothetical protein
VCDQRPDSNASFDGRRQRLEHLRPIEAEDQDVHGFPGTPDRRQDRQDSRFGLDDELHA